MRLIVYDFVLLMIVFLFINVATLSEKISVSSFYSQ